MVQLPRPLLHYPFQRASLMDFKIHLLDPPSALSDCSRHNGYSKLNKPFTIHPLLYREVLLRWKGAATNREASSKSNESAVVGGIGVCVNPSGELQRTARCCESFLNWNSFCWRGAVNRPPRGLPSFHTC
ncbi:hypothetical protein cyc_00433 [Cyclospora cayetanensis]|uniref:Uncharacterized protein n=1 Tax=Cyclospora cayetanensis TaxID=88456 RepID=A0A1D3D4R4_9EIME|nr:hypothetical protein cyc_00433 [Cyclospora cayetanensis]